jgi:TPR repeat protein
MSEPATQTESSEKKPSFLLLKALIFPVLVIPALVVTLLVIRGNEAEQLYYRAMDAADRGDFAAAASYFERASNLGHAQSAYNLALLYREGLIESPDSQKQTLTFLQKAADNGSLDAEYELGRIAEKSTPPNYEQAAMHYDKAARGEHPEGLFALARLYEKGLGIPKSSQLAVKFYEKAAEKGHTEAHVVLAELYLSDDPELKNPAAAEQHLLAVAEKNHPRACNMLGYFYEHRSNSASDRKLAGEYYFKAAQLNDPNGMVNHGDYLIAAGQTQLALSFYQQAAERHRFAPAQHRLGLHYVKLSTPDYKRAKEFFELAAQAGYAASWVNLGIMAEKGLGGKVDLIRAKMCYSKAAQKGHAEGKKLLEKLSKQQ